MMIATNWGVYEFGKRDPNFRDAGDPRDMQIRARSAGHLEALRERYPALGETVYLGDGVADFQYRVYITKPQLADMMRVLVMDDIDYIRFKEGALKDGKLYKVLSDFWTTLLRAYPVGSSYTTSKYEPDRKAKHVSKRNYDWDDPQRGDWRNGR